MFCFKDNIENNYSVILELLRKDILQILGTKQKYRRYLWIHLPNHRKALRIKASELRPRHYEFYTQRFAGL